MTSFNDLGLSAPLLSALETEGYTSPTPIQAQAIPGVLQGRDLLGIAQTGTGKTAAFALPILERLAADRRPAPRKGCRVLVLSPTRELATQIADSFRTYGKNLGMKVAVVFGGVAHRPQIQATRDGVDILVATPGRLIDHMDERNIDIAGTEILVLDEADQMLDLGFVKPIRRIVAKLAMKRQNLFFSATMPHEIGALAAELLRDPLKVSVAPAATTVERVEQKVIHIEAQKKRTLLVELLADAGMARTIVFTRTKRGADKVAKHLETAGIKSAAIHGNKSQAQRERALDAFREADIRVLVATDIAARGIDIDGVSHVVNFELPEVPEAYVHRIGRTARAGAAGIAISLCDAEERSQLREIERTTRRTIPSEDRRGDANLAVDKAMPRSASNENDGRGEGRRHEGRRDGHRGGRREGDRRDHGRREGSRPRTEGARPEGHRPEARTDAARPEGRRSEGHRSEGRRFEGKRPEGQRSEGRRFEGHRSEGQRSEGHRHEGRRDEPRAARPAGECSEHGRGPGQANGGHRGREGRPFEHRRDGRPHEGRSERPHHSRPHDQGAGERRDGRPARHGSDRAEGSANSPRGFDKRPAFMDHKPRGEGGPHREARGPRDGESRGHRNGGDTRNGNGHRSREGRGGEHRPGGGHGRPSHGGGPRREGNGPQRRQNGQRHADR